MKYLIMIMLGLSLAGESAACNTCGCAASNEYLGILSQLPGHFIGVQYQYRWYESRHDVTEPNKPVGHEYYQSLQVWGRYSWKRLQFYAFLPYQYNVKREGDDVNTMSGIGDMSVLANVQIVRPRTNARWQHSLLAGAGLKAPTGAYDKMVLGSGDQLAPSMQAGTGSWDYLANANYTIRRGRTGVNAEVAYTVTRPNFQDYKYGNRLSAGVQVFQQMKNGGLSLLPGVGMRYESSEADFDNYTVRSVAQYTGGYMMYASAGVQGSYKHFGMKAGYYLPVSQHYGDGLVKALGKTEVGVFYLF